MRHDHDHSHARTRFHSLTAVLLTLIALIALTCMYCPRAIAATPSAPVLPIGADGQWTTDLWLRNTSTTDTVHQRIGHLTFTHPPFDPIVLESTITLLPGQTRRILSANGFYDSGRNWVLSVDPRLDASAFLSFGAAQFEVSAVTMSLNHVSDTATFYRIAVDSATRTGTFPVTMNLNTVPVTLELWLYDADNVIVTNWTRSVPPGVSLFGVPVPIPNGGSLRVCHTACNVGANIVTEPVYVFVITGPNGGGTQAPRYAQ